MELGYAINQITNNYVAMAGFGFDAYLFMEYSLDNLNKTYVNSFSLDGSLRKEQAVLDSNMKIGFKQRQANLLLLQIISGLEVSLIQASMLTSLIQKQFNKPLLNDEIISHKEESLKQPWRMLWQILGESFLFRDYDDNFKKYFSEIKEHADKLYKSRHALMHRGGLVAKQDCPSGEEFMEISYYKLVFSLHGIETGLSYDLQELIDNKTLVSEPFNLMAQKKIVVARKFKIGEQVNFGYQDLQHIYLTFWEFTDSLRCRFILIINTLNFIQIIVTLTPPPKD